MTTRRLFTTFALILPVIALPCTLIHLFANPDDAPISPLQHVAAAVANFFGPWGVAIVRLVDFPNAGLRSFSWPMAVGLTLVGVLLVALAAYATQRLAQWLLATAWALFLSVWFGIGLLQIADGLL